MSASSRNEAEHDTGPFARVDETPNGDAHDGRCKLCARPCRWHLCWQCARHAGVHALGRLRRGGEIVEIDATTLTVPAEAPPGDRPGVDVPSLHADLRSPLFTR